MLATGAASVRGPWTGWPAEGFGLKSPSPHLRCSSLQLDWLPASCARHQAGAGSAVW